MSDVIEPSADFWNIETDEQLPPINSGVPKDLDDTSGFGDLVCEICGRTNFKNERGLKLHRAKTHGSGGDKVPSQARRKGKATRELQQDVETFLTSLGIAVTMANANDGAAIINGTPGLASALANIAERNPKVRAVLESMTQGFAYSELVTASAVIIIPIMANHGLLPERFGMAAAYITARSGNFDPSQAANGD